MRVLALVGVPAAVFADAATNATGWVSVAVAVIGLLAVATKQLVPGWVYTEQKERCERTEEENKRLTQTLLEALPKATAAMEAGNRLVEDQAAELRALRRAK